MSSSAEESFISFAARRFKVSRCGWPDFFVQNLKTSEFLGIEVKQGLDKISQAQRKMFAALEASGFKVVVWNPERPNDLVPWRTYEPKRPHRQRQHRPKLDSIAVYVRVQSEVHARVKKITTERGYPHTMASVASEAISRGLALEGAAAKKTPVGERSR